MPFEIKRWACDYCKRFVRADKKKIEVHEKTCFSNPERRACLTCRNEIWVDGRGCEKGLLMDTLEEKYATIGIRWNCKDWE